MRIARRCASCLAAALLRLARRHAFAYAGSRLDEVLPHPCHAPLCRAAPYNATLCHAMHINAVQWGRQHNMISALITILIYVLVFGLIWWLVTYLLQLFPLPEP